MEMYRKIPSYNGLLLFHNLAGFTAEKRMKDYA